MGAYFLLLKIRQHIAFNTGAELADFELLLWNTLRGDVLRMRCSDLSFLSEHFSPVLLLLVPLYAVAQTPYTLLVIHALAGAAAVIPLYLLVADETTARWPPVLLGLAYGVSRVVNYGVMYDFHMEIFYPALFFTAFLMYRRQRWALYYMTVGLAALVKEDAFVALLGLGLYLWLCGQKKHGAVTSALGLGGLLVSVGIIIPFFRAGAAGAGYQFASYWSGYGSAPGEIVLNMLNPARHLSVIFTPQKLQKMFNLFSVMLFLPFFSWRGLLFLVGPQWFMLYSSDNPLMNGPIIYYGLLITPFLFIASIGGMRALSTRWRLNHDRVLLWGTALVFLVQFGNSRIFKQLFEERWSIPERYARQAPLVVQAIPPGADVSAQIHMLPHVPPSPCRSFFPTGLDRVEYVLLDAQGDTWPLSPEAYPGFVDSLRHTGTWQVIREEEGFTLMKRSPPPLDHPR